MWATMLMWCSSARALALDRSETRVSSGVPSHASRRTGLSELPSRSIRRRAVANSLSTTRSRLSSSPGSSTTSCPGSFGSGFVIGSRTAQINPSPLERPDLTRPENSGSALLNRLRIRFSEVPLRALLVDPTITTYSLRPWRVSSTMKCGRGPTALPKNTRNCTSRATGSASVVGAIERTTSPASPYKRLARDRLGPPRLRNL